MISVPIPILIGIAILAAVLLGFAWYAENRAEHYRKMFLETVKPTRFVIPVMPVPEEPGDAMKLFCHMAPVFSAFIENGIRGIGVSPEGVEALMDIAGSAYCTGRIDGQLELTGYKDVIPTPKQIPDLPVGKSSRP